MNAPLIRACRVCGCTEMKACVGGCSWVEADLCSACDPVTKARHAEIRGKALYVLGQLAYAMPPLIELSTNPSLLDGRDATPFDRFLGEGPAFLDDTLESLAQAIIEVMSLGGDEANASVHRAALKAALGGQG